MSHHPSTARPPGPANDPGATAHPWYRNHHLHHLGVALVVACVVGFLHHGGYLGWLDAAMLRLTGATVHADPARAEPQHMPEVLLVSEAMYADKFKLSSPLNRDVLATTLRQVFKPGQQERLVPEALVFDIDLSDNGNGDPGQDRLDAVLQTLAAEGTRLFLPMPLPTGLPELQKAKLAWMHKVCSWVMDPQTSARLRPGVAPPPTVRLVSAQVNTHGGQVLQYNAQQLSLGTVAARSDGGADGCSLRPQERALHLNVLTQPHAEPLALPGLPKFSPFKQAYFAAMAQHTHRFGRDGALHRADGAPVALSGKVVFIGGDYDTRDRLLSPWMGLDQALPGVQVHAAVFYSVGHPLEVWHGLDFLLDVLVGFLAGTLFHKMWHVYQHHDEDARTRSIPGYLLAKGLFLLIPLVALALAAGLVMVSARVFYPIDLWVNPGPVVLGVVLKVLLASGRERVHSLPVLALQGLTVLLLLALYLPSLFH